MSDNTKKVKCGKCSKEVELSEAVNCDKCKTYYHGVCAKVNDNMLVWKCIICSLGEGSNLKPPPAPHARRSKSVTSKLSSKHSKESMEAKSKLVLNTFLEEKQLLDKYAKDKEALLKAKHETQKELLVRSVAKSKTSGKSSKKTSSSRASKTQALLDVFDAETELLRKQAEEKEALLKESHEKELDLLRRKQNTIMEMASASTVSSKSSVKVPSVTSAQKVQDWIKTSQVEFQAQVNEKIVSFPNPVDMTFSKAEIHSSTQLPGANFQSSKYPNPTIAHQTFLKNQSTHPPPTVNATFNLADRERADNAANYERKILSREEIAARHVTKELPKFDGTPKMWPRFIAAFHRTTRNCGFSYSENLDRLNGALTGNAFTAVKSSLNMEEKVPMILETLELLYGKPEFIINSLLDDLRESPAPTIESIDSILRYSLEIENISSTMVYAKLAEHIWNPLLLTEMVERLPPHLKLKWASYKYKNSPCSIEIFSMWLKSKAVTYSSILTKPPNVTMGASKRESKHSVNIHQTSEKSECIICSKGCKSITVCDKFKDMQLNVKWDTIRRLQVCRICLTKHRGRRCIEDSVCGIDGCQYRHHKLLHNKKELPEDNPTTEENVPALNVHAGEKTYFKILPVFLIHGGKKLMTYAMFDDGSSLTLVDKSVAQSLGLVGEQRPLCLRWTNGVEHRDAFSEVVSLQISQHSDGRTYRLKNVHTIENLQLPSQSVNMEQLSKRYPHLRDLNITSFENAQPLLLIGLNHSNLMEVKKYKFGSSGEPAAAKTSLGWCVFGSRASGSESVLHINQCKCEENSDQQLEDIVRQNYSLEAIGISTPLSLPQVKTEKLALEILNRTTKLCGSRFEVGLLWKFKQIKLPNSLPMAKRRLQCLENKIKSEPALRGIINNQIDDYLRKGYAVKLDQSALQDVDCWYLPIFVVRNINKPNKLRMVWDAAASANGVCLNDILLKGPDLLASLPGVLMRFREHSVAITGDIKEMFHQILVKPSDRKYQRFLWRPEECQELQVYEMCVMTFGATCSPSCSQFVKNLNADRFKDTFPLAVEAIKNNHYVDDWLQSVDSEAEAVTLANQVREVHEEGGFKIHKWISNIPSVVKNLSDASPQNEKSMELSPLFEADKVLGMYWTTSSDTFKFILKVNEINEKLLNGSKAPSKRQVLKFLMSIFDPLGLITPILIFAKILLQMIWRSKTAWDEEISTEQHNLWLSWVESLNCLSNVSIPRWIGLTSDGTQIEMHTFVDASEDAFTAAVYFKVMSETGIKCSLITSKSRVAPLKPLSIPRLELQAAVIGSRLAKFVVTSSSPSHKIVKRFFWTDSETVIKWLHSDNKKYSQYVSCRVGEIFENSNISEWNWIAGKKNVADMGTKMKLFDEIQLQEWFHGPQFLFSNDYPIQKVDSKPCEEELRPKEILCQIAVHDEAEYRISKWLRLRRVFAHVHRYVSNLKRSIHKESPLFGPISRTEYQRAETHLIKKAQIEGYPVEYAQLKDGKRIQNKKSAIYKDSAFMDSVGVLRAKGRVQATSYISYDVKNPILLPKNHRITEMILQFYHEKYHHMFHSTVLNEVKQKFVVPRLKVKLREIRSRCQFCKNRDAKPKIPEECELPPARITPFTRAFTFIGVDYFGPVQVVVGRRSEKRWVMLVTCLTTRALHLETVQTLTSDSCILALSRFMNRRGKPREIYTDNGTNFRGSARELREIWKKIDKNVVAERFIDEDTEWMFIPPASPHMGGAWERMVRTVKTSLKVAMPFRVPSDEVLYSMLVEVENVINNRPLTYVELENEEQEALTPNHFILGSSSGVKPIGEFDDSSKHLRANWHKSQRFANVFWKRWVLEYLPTLNRRTKWFEPQKPEIEVGDIVVVLGEDKRGSWPKGKIIEVHKSRDNKIRSAAVQLETGIYTRPVSKLAVLDVSNQEDSGTLEASARIPGGSVISADSPSPSTSPAAGALEKPPERLRILRPMPHRTTK